MQSLSDTRRTFLATLGAALPLLASNKRPPVILPNVVLIVADEIPANAVGCYGGRAVKTPNIDALAARGVRFRNALASGRGGVSGRATLLAGVTPMQKPSDIFLTDLLSAKGYDVGYAGEWGFSRDRQPGHGIRWSNTETARMPAAEFLEQQKGGAKPFFLTVTNPPGMAVDAIDNEVGAVVSKIHQRGLEENTMVVFTSAGSTVDALHVPLIYCWPGHAPVQASRPDMVGAYDLFYTVCDAAQAAPPERNLCGRSYLPLVQGRAFPKKRPWRSIIYGSFADAAGTADTASDNRFKLVIGNEGKGPNQFFDLRADPTKSLTNQYANRTFITSRDLLRRSLAQWKNQYSR